MKIVISILLLISGSTIFKPTENITGTWKCVRARYGAQPMKERTDDIYKTFTATRWSAVFYNKQEKKFDGAGGGTYVLKDDQYTETIEYYSWEPEAAGRSYTFTLKVENGMLHQTGSIEYKGNTNYIIDEWFKRVD